MTIHCGAGVVTPAVIRSIGMGASGEPLHAGITRGRPLMAQVRQVLFESGFRYAWWNDNVGCRPSLAVRTRVVDLPAGSVLRGYDGPSIQVELY